MVIIFGEMVKTPLCRTHSIVWTPQSRKTFLVDETFRDRICFRHAGLSPIGSAGEKSGRNRMKDQLMHFHHSLKVFGGDCRKPESWLEAFYSLEDFLSKKFGNDQRILVFIDEIQWLDTPRAGFMTGFEAFWNGWALPPKECYGDCLRQLQLLDAG